MGATVVALLVCGETAYTAEVGDSRAYVLRDGALMQITKDQTYVQLLIERGAMSPDSVRGSTAKNVILQGLGKTEVLCVAQRKLALRNGDLLLLCSDGLSSFVSDVEIASVLASNPSLGDACSGLVAMANERGGQDNITVVAAAVTGPLPPPKAGEALDQTLTTLRAFSLGE
jgi:protein phosphatase